jgi:uncharacterized MAPEG superfamily protein
MTIELRMLAFSIVFGLVQLLLAAHGKSLQYGYHWAAGARDEQRPPLAGLAGRLDRATKNFAETFPFFVAAVVIAHLAGRHNALTVWGAQLYFWGRLAYLPLYAFGVRYIRSLAWNVAGAGIALLLIALF